MDYVKPVEVVENMIGSGITKASLPVKELLVRGFLSGAGPWKEIRMSLITSFYCPHDEP
jgi:hypothetical protein